MRALMAIGLAAALAVGVKAQTTELKVGDTAPDFSLQASDGKTYKLSDFKGKRAVVVAWFPKAFTQGCTIECKSLAENGDKIRMYDVAYFMASVDSVEDNTKFAKATSVTLQGRGGGQRTVVEKKEADFPMLADPTKEVATKYGVLMPDPPGSGQPLDVLHRQGGQDRLHREEGAARDVGRGHDREARGAQGPHEPS